jgi:hypothetical protein
MKEILKCKIGVNRKGIFPIPANAFRITEFNSAYILYVLKEDSTFVYVGVTIQEIQTRFGSSFYAYKNQKNKKIFNGYSGYKWIEDCLKKNKKLSLHLFSIGKEINKNSSKENKIAYKIYAEAVEAELVYKIRRDKKSWPKYQHEIHFHNLEGAKEKAAEIYEIVNK